MKLKKKQIWLLVFVLGVVVVIFLLAYSLIPQALVVFTRAAPATKVSLTESYVLGEKILCRADGEDKCIINVFLLDRNGKPVVGKSVSMEGEAVIESINQLSDKDGKVSFEIRSETEGQSNLQGMYENVPIGSIVTVTFRN